MDHSTKETALEIKSWDEVPINFTGIIKDKGNYHWFLNGHRHRENDSAIECSNHNQFWFLNGNLHREDGPAISYFESGIKYWYLNGLQIDSQEVWFEQLTPEQKEKAVWNMDSW